ncbi:hypothetical protein EIP86_010233 [Pleurotus ostreatoroseus]|nr:hypothetical protein EIP86_010233 [Pleurotus ostreatoroseus]
MLIHFHGPPTQETSPKEGPASPNRTGTRGLILRSKKEIGYMTKTTKRTSTLAAITRFFTANPQFAAHVRNLHLALALPSRKIWLKLGENGSTTVDRPSSDEVDREYRNNLPVTDASTLLATLRVFPHLDSLVLYDVTLRGPFNIGIHGPIDVPRLRLSFTGRKGEEAPLAEYVNVLGLFRAVDELWIDSFGDKARPDAPDALAHTERFTLSPRIVHIDPLPTAAYAAVAKIVACSLVLRYVEIVSVYDPRQQRAAFRPRSCDGAADEQRLTVVVHLMSGGHKMLFMPFSWEEAANRAWPFVARPGVGATTLVVARNTFPATRGKAPTVMGQNDMARVLGYLDALPGPLPGPLLLCHLLWFFRDPNSKCRLCCAELNATRARANTDELTNMLAQLVVDDKYPEGCHNALDIVRGLGMVHDYDKVLQRRLCVCGPPLPNARTLVKS